MIIDVTNFDEVYLEDSEVYVMLSDGHWFGQYGRYHAVGYEMLGTKLATRLCGSVFILTGDGETEAVRLRQALPGCNFIYPQIRFRPQPDDPKYDTPYERDANRTAPFKMAMEQVTPEFRKTVAPYFADREYSSDEFPPRLFWMDEEVYMLLKMKF